MDYRPGVLLQHLRSDLAGFELEWLAADRACFRSAALAVEVSELVEPQFLMHVVSSEFSCRFLAACPQPAVISAHHRGAWRRTGVAFAADVAASHRIVERLEQSEPLRRALETLDFTHWRLHGCQSGWRLSVRHFGASEVVGRMPAFRRYIRLERSQRDALLASVHAAGAVLSDAAA